ncbi:MAG: 2-oxoacid:ferredoxin oxidoreductase subunit gamma [Candidatus Thorarchaeota archaeon]|nr:2-oxoacid:ferredoxin oxidoreductase subunit gamma [Candidatus Thorarchaeota archaeon]
MGVVLAGVILGHTAVIHAGLNAVQTQSYGSEARGTAAKSEIILSNSPIRYPKVREADYSILMSQKAFDMYLDGAKKESVLIVDPDLVDSQGIIDYEIVEIPAMRVADEMGLRVISNMVMIGAFVKKSGVFGVDALELSLKDFVSSNALEKDIEAVRAGANLV